MSNPSKDLVGACDPAAPVPQRPCSKCGQPCNVEVCAKCAALSSNPNNGLRAAAQRMLDRFAPTDEGLGEAEIAAASALRAALRSAHETTCTEHPERHCERCHGPNVTWFVASELWNAAHGQWDILCPHCFVQLAEAAGIRPTAWELAPEALPVKASERQYAGDMDQNGKIARPKDGPSKDQL